MTRPLKFLYKINGYGGISWAVSVAQALDRSKNDYLRVFLGVDIESPRFRIEKGKMQDTHVHLELAPLHYTRYKWLYRTFKDGDCTQAEVHELESLQQIINDPRLK